MIPRRSAVEPGQRVEFLLGHVREGLAGDHCGECEREYVVRHRASGRTWRTADGYERAREVLGDEW